MIFKIKFAQVKDGRVFVNVNDVIELQEAFERFAKSISLVMDVMDVRPEDLDFFRTVLDRNKGNQKLKFFIKNLAVGSKGLNFGISYDLLHAIE